MPWEQKTRIFQGKTSETSEMRFGIEGEPRCNSTTTLRIVNFCLIASYRGQCFGILGIKKPHGTCNASRTIIDQLTNLIDLSDGTHLSMFMEDRRPRCYTWGSANACVCVSVSGCACLDV